MKRFKFFVGFLVIILNFLIVCPVLADVMPHYTGSISKETIGFIQVPKSFKLYSYPRDDSKVIENISWTNTEVNMHVEKIYAEPYRLFIAQSEGKNLAFCEVIDEDGDWYKIIYDRSDKKTGWIKPDAQEDFWGLKDFYTYFGKRYGLYYMKNIDYRKRGLYSGADNEAQKIGGFTLIKSIHMNKLSGNWALVTVTDLDHLPKIGYIRWRESDGSIVLFPKIGE